MQNVLPQNNKIYIFNDRVWSIYAEAEMTVPMRINKLFHDGGRYHIETEQIYELVSIW